MRSFSRLLHCLLKNGKRLFGKNATPFKEFNNLIDFVTNLKQVRWLQTLVKWSETYIDKYTVVCVKRVSSYIPVLSSLTLALHRQLNVAEENLRFRNED